MGAVTVPIPQALGDERRGEVVFLSHCLLNQNTRYPGGAVRPGVVEAAVMPHLEAGVGIVQMPCPEQLVWGGVTKRHLLRLLGHPALARASRPLVPLVHLYLRWRYRRLARRVASEIADYRRSGLTTVGVVGVAGSPSCGVATTLDLTAAAHAIGTSPRGAATASWMRDTVVEPAVRRGRGIFVAELSEQLDRRGLHPPLHEHVLVLPVASPHHS